MAARIILILAFLTIITEWLCMSFLAWELTKVKKKIEDLKTGKFDEAVHSHMNVEQRCQHCRGKDECPAYDSGVLYPCGYYQSEEEEEHD